MKTCPYCRQDLPDDATFCTHCGKPLEQVKEEVEQKLTKRERAKVEKEKIEKEKAERNIWTVLGVVLFLVALIGFDGIIAMIFNGMHWNYKIVFGISSLLYIGVIGCGIKAILVDRQSKKDNKEPSGNSMLSYAEIVLSLYIVLVNVQQVLMK